MRAGPLLVGLVALVIVGLGAGNLRAAENAAGIYLLGIKTSMAGFVPPPGTYVQDINFAYSGSASGSAAVGVALRQTGNLTVQADIDVTGNAYINLPIALWVAPQKVLGGNVGFGLLTPFGWKGRQRRYRCAGDADAAGRDDHSRPDGISTSRTAPRSSAIRSSMR